MPTPQDYSQYSLPELYNLAHDFDGENPEIKAEILLEIEKRKRGERKSERPYTPTGTFVIIMGICCLAFSINVGIVWGFLCILVAAVGTASLKALDKSKINDAVERNNLIVGRACAMGGFGVSVYKLLQVIQFVMKSNAL